MRDKVGQTWKAKLDSARNLKCASDANLAKYWDANVNSVAAVLDKKMGGDGYKVVYNIASAHIGSFCKDGYLNAYDLKSRGGAIGEEFVSNSRELVDRTLSVALSVVPERVYFGAVEANGQGVGFYGDICLVLNDDKVPPSTAILDRNSYDLIRSPISDEVAKSNVPAVCDKIRIDFAERISGKLGDDIGEIAALKVAELIAPRERRLTTGMISDAICNDEDYIEVLNTEPFGASDVKEARVSAADVAVEERINRKSSVGGNLTLSEMIWVGRRKSAELSLTMHGIPIRVVTMAGRLKN